MSDVPRKRNGKRRFTMDYIEDRELFKAVMFARKMIGQGASPPIAISRAAKYYDYETSDVARYVGQAAGTTAGRRRHD